MDCPICKNRFNLRDNWPIQLNCSCKKALCHSCALYMLNVGTLACPGCAEAAPYVNGASELKEHPEVVAQLQEEDRQSQALCFLHPNKRAERLCKTHVLPLCESCGCPESCELEPLRPCPGKVLYFLMQKVEQAVAISGRGDCLLGVLRERYNHRYDGHYTVQELLELYRYMHRGRPLCRFCLDDKVDLVDLTDMELYCATCVDRLTGVPEVIPISQLTYEDVVMYTCQYFPSISFWHLDKAQLSWLRHRDNDILASLSMSKTIVALKEDRSPEPKKCFFCPGCLGFFNSTAYFLFRLPCPGAVHALCRKCAVHPTCPLDGQNYHGQVLHPIVHATPFVGDEETELRQSDDKYADPTDPTEVWSPTSKPPTATRVGKGHELSDRGIPIPPFISCFPDERLQVWERYLRVLPENPLQYQKGTFEDPWYVSRHSSQIEALTFCCFRTVWLRGVSLANPVEQGKVVNVVSATLHEGNKALGRGDLCDCLNRELQGGGGRVLTDIYFSEGKRLQEMEVYTLKLKLLGTNPAEKIAIYHGNHIGRYEDGQSSDGTAWNCEPTAGVDIEEKNSGQHELLSPILRLIYSY